MRRSHNANLRRAQVDAGIVRSILGHTAEAMSVPYDHVHPSEKHAALGRVVRLDVATLCGNTGPVATTTGPVKPDTDEERETRLEFATASLGMGRQWLPIP